MLILLTKNKNIRFIPGYSQKKIKKRILFPVNDMKKEYTFNELLHKAASYCSISEHCISEVNDKLKAWQVDEDGFVTEGSSTNEYYLNGFSSSLPWEIQWKALHKIRLGFQGDHPFAFVFHPFSHHQRADFLQHRHQPWIQRARLAGLAGVAQQ